MSALLYMDVEFRPTTVTESFFHTLDSALAVHHFVVASESPKPGEMAAYRYTIKSDSPGEFIPWPDYRRRFDRDEMLHIRYACGPCALFQAMDAESGEPLSWGMTCWLYFSEPQVIKNLHVDTGLDYRWFGDEVRHRCLEHLKRICDTLHERLGAIDTALFRENEDEGDKLPEAQRLLYRVA